MTYNKVRFSVGLDSDGYIENDDSNGDLVPMRFTDLDGNTLTMPRVYEVYMIDAYCDKPAWGK